MSIFLRIFILMLIVGIFPLVLMSSFYLISIEDTIHSTIYEATEKLAKEIGDEVALTIFDAFNNIKVLADNPVLTSADTDREQIHHELIKTQKFYTVFEDITYLNTKGIIYASVYNKFRGTWQSTTWFNQALNGKAVLSNVHAVLYPFEIVMTASAPVLDNNELTKGVIIGQISMDKIRRITRRFKTEYEIWLIDENAVIIEAPDPDIILTPVLYEDLKQLSRNKRSGIVPLNDTGITKIAIHVPIKPINTDHQLNWSIAIISKKNTLFAPIYRVRTAIIIAFFTAIAVILLLSRYLSLNLKKRVNKILHATNALGDWDFTINVPDLGEDELGELGRAFNNARDKMNNAIIKQRKAEKKLKKLNNALEVSKKRYELAVKGANDAIWDWNIVNAHLYISPRWWEIIRLNEKKAKKNISDWFLYIHRDDIKEVKKVLEDHIEKASKYFEVEYRIIDSGGEIKWILSRGIAIRDKQGFAVRMAGSHSDITLKKQLQERLTYFAYNDTLTELPNRKYIYERIQQSIYRAQRDSHYSFSLLYLDLDGFKHVNDTYGHATGDLLLVAIAKRLKSCVRPLDVVSHFGGDEFVILLEGINEKETIESINKRILTTCEQEFIIEDQSIFVTVSIGVLNDCPPDSTPDVLIQNADIAMYYSKMHGKDQWNFFTEELKTKERKRWSLEHELHKSLGTDELQIYFQPIISSHSQQLYGFEALLRWFHKKRGIISPAEFIPAAEESGFITKITRWLIEQTCDYIKDWNTRILSGDDYIVISLNVTAKDFNVTGGLDTLIINTITQKDCKPAWLAIEVTEGSLIQNYEIISRQLKKLQEFGVKVELDDFGTGYSSLAYINKFPLDMLKVDRSFIQTMMVNISTKKIVNTIVNMAHDLNLQVVAEGVEEQAQLEVLQAINCEFVQGYYFSKPMHADEVEDFIHKMQK